MDFTLWKRFAATARVAVILLFSVFVCRGDLFAVASTLSDAAQVKVSGTVRIPRNAMSPLAIVELRGIDGRSVYASSKTDGSGRYTISASVPVGWCTLVIGSPACLPVMVPFYVESQTSLDVEASLRKYQLKDANVRFLPIAPTQAKGRLTAMKDAQGCWNASVRCGSELHYQVAGDEVDGRTHCPNGFADFKLDEGGDCVGMYSCTGDSIKIMYCPDINPAETGVESITFLDKAAEHRRVLNTSLERVMDTLMVLRNLNQIEAWYQEARRRSNMAVDMLKTETDAVSRALVFRHVVELSAITWYVKKDTIDARVLEMVDNALLQYPSTWALNRQGPLPSFAFFASAPRVQQHFEAFETSNTADQEYIAGVLSNLIEVYDHLKKGPVARNYERLLTDKYSATSTAEDFTSRKSESAKLIGHMARTIRGENLEGAQSELRFPMTPQKLVLLDFWATWCKPCIAEIEHMLTITDSIRARGIEIIGVAVNDHADKVAAFRTRKSIPWQSIMLRKEGAGETLEFYNATGIPQLVLVSPNGTVLAAGDALRGAKMLETIDEVLQTRRP